MFVQCRSTTARKNCVRLNAINVTSFVQNMWAFVVSCCLYTLLFLLYAQWLYSRNSMKFWMFLVYFPIIETVKLPFQFPKIDQKKVRNYKDNLDFRKGFSTRMKFVLGNCLLESYKGEKYIMMLGNWSISELSFLSDSYSSLLVFDMTGFNNLLFSAHYRRLKTIVKINKTVLESKTYPAHIVIIEETQEFNFSIFLEAFHDSIFWNSQAFFLVVNKNPKTNCPSAYSVLNSASKYELLSTFYLCMTLSNSDMLYTYNPFSSVATSFWKKGFNLPTNPVNWTLLSCDITELPVIKDTKKCYFDRTIDLSHYKVLFGAEVANKSIYVPRSSKIELSEIKENYPGLIEMVIKHIRASYDVNVYTVAPALDVNGKPQGAFLDLVEGKIDVITRVNTVAEHWKLQTNFIKGSDIHVVSRKCEVSDMQKFIAAIDPDILVNIILSFIMFIVVSKVILKLSWSISYFEFIRIFTSSMDKKTFQRARYSSERILMCTIILLTSCSSVYLESLFSAVNTISDYKSTIETIDDFKNNEKLTIYVHTPLANQINTITGRTVIPYNDYNACVDRIMRDDRVICVGGTVFIRTNGGHESKLIHISKPLLNTRTVVYPIRSDWSLLTKFNLVLLRLYETGITEKYFESIFIDGHTNHEVKMTLRFEEMNFVFSMIVGGLVFAIFVFILELINKPSTGEVSRF